MIVTIIPAVIGAFGTVTKGLAQGGVGNNRTGGDCPNYCIVEIGQNIEESGYLRKLAVTQTL